MGKGSKTANEQVAVAPVVRRKEKSGNNEKRKAAEALEKTISAKRKKVDADVKKVQAPPPKEEESTSTEEDTYSESEEEEKVEAEVKMVQAPPPKEKEDTSTEEDTYSESEEEEKVEAEVKKVQAPPPKEEESISTEEDTYSESEEEEKVAAEVKKVQAPPQKEEEYTSTEEDTYSESEEEEKVEAEVKKVQAPPHKEKESTSTEEDTYSESEEEEKVEAEVKKVQTPPPKEEESTSTEDAYSESEEEEKVEAEVKKVQAPPSKEEESTSTKEDTYSESKEEEVSMRPKTPIGNQSEHGVTRIFVGNLPSKVDEDDIAALFKEAGEVIEVRLARWKQLKDDKSKGFCHVEFATEEAAKRALEMNQQEFMGCELRVQLAKPEKRRKDNSSIHKGEDEGSLLLIFYLKNKEYTVMMKDTPSPDKSYGKAKSNEKEPKTHVGNQHEHGMATIFVANLPFTANEDEIAAFFKEAGEVIEVRLSRGYCHVEFATEEAAKRALEMKHEFMGRELILDMGIPNFSSTCRREKKPRIHMGEDENTAVMMKDTPSLDKSYGKAKSNENEPKTLVGNQNEHGMATIRVKNLPSIAIEHDIAAFFKEAGEVIEVRLPKNRDKSRGHCHVKFATEEAAKRALEMKHEFMGRELILDMGIPNFSSTCRREKKPRIHMGEDENTAVMMKDTPSLDKSYGKAKSNENEPKTLVGNQNEHGMATIRVKNLPSIAIEHDIAAFFKEAGEVIEVRLPKNRDKSRGHCHVKFATEEAAKRALEMKHEFMGRELILDMGIPNFSSTCRREKKPRIHMGEDENTAVMMKDTPSLDKSYGKAKSNENEPKTLVGNQNEHGMATIRVTNLPSIAIEHDIAAFFKEAGEVIEVRLPKNKDKSRGHCHVKFATEEAAKRALEMKHEFMGHEIKLDMGTRKVSSSHRSGQGNRRKHGGGDRGRGGGRGRGRGGRGSTCY